MLIKILKLFGYQLFEARDKNFVCAISKHSLQRAKQRITEHHMLRIVADMALQYGENSVHFDYFKDKKEKKYGIDGMFAKKFRGYIFIFDKKSKLLTVYNVSNIADIMITRKSLTND